eukprot:TRINITY_DN8431_c0_g1::TRINITY_DN8431_c0_g1_i1::g.3441::m.3441 TRINITY_DN8431_c0_g1::TRINITY_DN8431_c0_g1_i1::g.3441  ORF type:complete len:104 (+),score=7.33 TRINITY_DN8431_c0_g1_i1:240-551(+)
MPTGSRIKLTGYPIYNLGHLKRETTQLKSDFGHLDEHRIRLLERLLHLDRVSKLERENRQFKEEFRAEDAYGKISLARDLLVMFRTIHLYSILLLLSQANHLR